MKTIVITGSTRGLGYALAQAFLANDCEVVISGRTEAAAKKAVGSLVGKYGAEKILGAACDVADFGQVESLWERAVERFGKVDVWINNAGIGQGMVKFWELDAVQIKEIVEINLTGIMYGAKVALTGMLAQGFGALYNMEGSGSDGRGHGLTVYESSKRGGRYLTDALIKQVADTGVIVGALSPGMLVTDLVTDQMKPSTPDSERLRRVMNIIADRVESVAPWLVKQVLANEKNGAHIRWMTRGRVIWRFLTAPFVTRDVFGEGK